MATWLKRFLLDKRFFLIGLILAAALLWPLLAAPYFSHHDDLQVIRVYEMHQCIKDLQIPCRWVPNLGGLYGYPLFNFYAPLPYYIGEVFYLISGNLIFSAKMIFALSFILAYFFMYLLGRRVWGEVGGVFSGILYSYAPYHGLDLYVRGAMGEMWALTFFPLILWALFKLEEKRNLSNSLILALCLTLLILSHNLSAMIFLPIVIFFSIFLYFKNKEFKFIKLASLSFILGFLLSSFYFLPMVFEKELVHVDTTTFGYFSYTEHFKGVRELFLDRSWGWGSSIREVPGGEKEQISFQIGVVHVLVWLISLYLIMVFWRTDKYRGLLFGFCSVIILFSIFMVHPASQFIWDSIDSLKYLQFPWRFLMFIILFISFIGGSIFLFIKKDKYKISFFIILTALVVLANFSYFKPEKFFNVSDNDFLTGQGWDKQIKRSIFDYLPIFAKAPPAELATSRYEILSGYAKVQDLQEGSNWVRFKAEVKKEADIRLSKYYFPDWKVFLNGNEVNIRYDNQLGLITFTIPEGNHLVEVRLYDTPIRKVGNYLTILGFLSFGLLYIYTKRNHG